MTLIQSLDSKRLDNFGRMTEDMIVSRYMAEIDTRLDRIVLEWRWLDGMNTLLGTGRRPYAFENQRAIVAREEHDARPADLQRLIEEIRGSSSDSNIPAERHADIGFGSYDANDDKYLAMVLDYAGPDFADAETGSTEWAVHVMRFGRVLLISNDQGFKDLSVFETEELAITAFEEADTAYDEWASEEEE